MQGMSEREYAARAGLSRGAIQKAKSAGRLVLHEDGSIDADASDRRRAEATDPTKSRKPPAPKMKPVPEAAVAAVGETLREQGLAVPAAAWLAARAAEGRRVLMVGDGLNDTAALGAAHASLAPASGLEAARSLADVVMVSVGLGRVADLIGTARHSLGRMRQNIAIALIYNCGAIPVALAGLASPLLAALAMSLSSLNVTLNAVRRSP